MSEETTTQDNLPVPDPDAPPVVVPQVWVSITATGSFGAEGLSRPGDRKLIDIDRFSPTWMKPLTPADRKKLKAAGKIDA
jgi:hypothetical protein